MRSSALDDLAMMAEDERTRVWAGAVASGVREARDRNIQLLAGIRLDADIAREMWEHTDFNMLYDEQRGLFSIGYNLNEGRLDPSFYDLLASEARLASFLAVAKGDVPQEHWFRLGRSLTDAGPGRALVSWSGSMFEYLMPLLVMHSLPGTLLDETYLDRGRAAAPVRRRPRRAVGRLGSGVQREGCRPHLPVPGVRRAGPRPQAGAGRRHRGRALRLRPRSRGRSAHRGPEPRGLLPARRRGHATATTSRWTSPPDASPRGSGARSCRRTSRTIRAWRSSPSATRCSTTRCATGSTATPSSPRRSCCCRSGSRGTSSSSHRTARRSSWCVRWASCPHRPSGSTPLPTRPSPPRTSCPTAGIPSWSPAAAAATPDGGAWPSRATARTSPETCGAPSSTCGTPRAARPSRSRPTRGASNPTSTR